MNQPLNLIFGNYELSPFTSQCWPTLINHLLDNLIFSFLTDLRMSFGFMSSDSTLFINTFRKEMKIFEEEATSFDQHQRLDMALQLKLYFLIDNYIFHENNFGRNTWNILLETIISMSEQFSHRLYPLGATPPAYEEFPPPYNLTQ